MTENSPFKRIWHQVLGSTKLIGWFVIYQITSLFLLAATESKAPTTRNKLLGLFVITTGLSLFAIIHSYWKNNGYWHKATGLSIGNILKWVGFAILMLLIQQSWQILIENHWLSDPTNQKIIDQQTVALPFWNQVDTIFIAPIFEELIFRGLFFKYLIPRMNKRGQILGLIISSLIFGYLHELNWDSTMIMYSLLGFILGCTYLHFKDIRYDIGLHIFNNLLASI